MCSMRRFSGPTGQPGRYEYGSSSARTADTVPTNEAGAVVVGSVADVDGTTVVGSVAAGTAVGGTAVLLAERLKAWVSDEWLQAASAQATTTAVAAKAPGLAIKAYRSPAVWGAIGGAVHPAGPGAR